VSVVLLVRHGQASWGADDYDVLSDVGRHQARRLGQVLAERGLRPTVVTHGQMRRQTETARLVAETAGWAVPSTVDERWDEMDHLQVLDRQPHRFAGDAPTPAEFQAWFEAATERWTGGEFDHEYDESFPSFARRVEAALAALLSGLEDDGTAVVVTSGGPISWLAAGLLGGGVELHRRFAPVVVNASVTKVVVGRRGTTLVSFNEHGHLETDRELLTYR
jgi:broad specificity phosphatase PhoE